MGIQKRRKGSRKGFLTKKWGSLTFIALAFVAFVLSNARSGSNVINVQGKLTDINGNLLTSTSPVLTFRLYQNSTDPVSANVWQDTFVVNLTSGLFNIALGAYHISLDTVAFNVPLYVGIQVAGDSQEMSRQLLGASAYALGSVGN